MPDNPPTPPPTTLRIAKIDDGVLPKFSGEPSEDPALWLERFERIARLAEWAPKDIKPDDDAQQAPVVPTLPDRRAEYFPVYLKHMSSADLWYDTLPLETKTNYKTLSKEFMDRFHNEEGLRMARLQRFQARKLQPDETVDAFIDDIRRQAARLGKGDKDIIDTVKMGLPLPIRQFVHLQNPASLDDLVTCARKAQSFSGSATINMVDEDAIEDLCAKVCKTVLDTERQSRKPSVSFAETDRPTTPQGPRDRSRSPFRARDRAATPPARPNSPAATYGFQDRPPTYNRPHYSGARQYAPHSPYEEGPRYQARPPFQRGQHYNGGRPQGNRRPQQLQDQRRWTTHPQQGRYNRPGNSYNTLRAPCPKCGGPHWASSCRLRNPQCGFCGFMGHIARVCRRARAERTQYNALNQQ